MTAIWKGHKPSSKLSEAEIGRMLEQLDLSADEFWLALRRLIGLVGRGVPEEDSVAPAADAAASLDLVAITDRPDMQRHMIAEELHDIKEQLRIGNLIAMRAAWTPVEARCSEDMQDFYHIGNQIDADISKSLGISEE